MALGRFLTYPLFRWANRCESKTAALITESQRDLNSLTTLLDRIDHVVLAAKRRVLVALPRESLGS